MKPLDPELRALIDDGMAAAVPPPAVEANALQGLLERVGNARMVPDVGVDGPPPSAGTGPEVGLTSGGTSTSTTIGTAWTKVGLVAALVVGGAGAATLVDQQSPSSPSSPSSGPSEEATAAPRPTATVVPRHTNPAVPSPVPPPYEVPVEQGPATKHTPAPDFAPSVRPNQLRAEANVIAKAEAALDADHPQRALELCLEHERRFDEPQLHLERDAIAASAACMLDPADIDAARSFADDHPRSVLTTKIRRRCALP